MTRHTRRRLASLLTLPLLTAGITTATTQPAFAWDGMLEICNSSLSPSGHSITIYNLDNYDATKKYVSPGDCKWVADRTGGGSDRARVSIPWFDKYYIGQEGEGYGPCHNGPNSDSNPPSIGDNGQYVKYKLVGNPPC